MFQLLFYNLFSESNKAKQSKNILSNVSDSKKFCPNYLTSMPETKGNKNILVLMCLLFVNCYYTFAFYKLWLLTLVYIINILPKHT